MIKKRWDGVEWFKDVEKNGKEEKRIALGQDGERHRIRSPSTPGVATFPDGARLCELKNAWSGTKENG